MEKLSEITCMWECVDTDEWVWESECGEEWILTEGTPRQNGMAYCPFCGKRMIEVEL